MVQMSRASGPRLYEEQRLFFFMFAFELFICVHVLRARA